MACALIMRTNLVSDILVIKIGPLMPLLWANLGDSFDVAHYTLVSLQQQTSSIPIATNLSEFLKNTEVAIKL